MPLAATSPSELNGPILGESVQGLVHLGREVLCLPGDLRLELPDGRCPLPWVGRAVGLVADALPARATANEHLPLADGLVDAREDLGLLRRGAAARS
eukprot:6562622-Alexandrium_andersonii.AAC.1